MSAGHEPGSSPADASAQATGESAASPHLDRVIQAQIGDKLRTLYGDLSGQPVPDRLVALIASLTGPT